MYVWSFPASMRYCFDAIWTLKKFDFNVETNLLEKDQKTNF